MVIPSSFFLGKRRIWSLQRNCYMAVTVYKDALWKRKSQSSLTRWRHRLFWYCCWSYVRRYVSTVSVYNLPRLCTLNVDRSNMRKWLYSLKKKKARSRQYPTETIKDADYADNIALLANTPTQAESLLHILEQAAGDIGLQMNVKKIGYMCFNQEGTIFTLNGRPLKLVDKFTYPGSSISSTESDVSLCLVTACTAIGRLSITWKFLLFKKKKKSKKRRCPWCNGYRRRMWTRRYEFKSWTWLIAFHIALIPLGKVWIQIFSLQLWVNSRAD